MIWPFLLKRLWVHSSNMSKDHGKNKFKLKVSSTRSVSGELFGESMLHIESKNIIDFVLEGTLGRDVLNLSHMIIGFLDPGTLGKNCFQNQLLYFVLRLRYIINNVFVGFYSLKALYLEILCLT